MNPGEFPNPGAGPGRPAPNTAMRMNANMQVPKNDSVQAMMTYVAQMLQNQGPYGGWKSEVPIKTRATNVYQMITSLRLIQPRIDLHQAAQAAMSFELKAFTKANEKSEYEKECTEKLLHIRNTRERQAAVAYQSGMMPQTGGQNQIPGTFPQHINQSMQTSPVSGQQQMAMGMNGQNQQAAIQQQQRQQQQQQSQAMLQQQQQQQQRPQQRPGNGIPMVDDLSTLSPQELDHVSRLANEMLNKTTPEDMAKIKLNLSNMTPEQRQYLARKKLEPMTYFFRSQALNQIRRHRRARLDMAGRAPNAGMDANGNMMGDPMMNSQHQRQMLQNMLNLQRNSAFPGNPSQTMEPPNFIGNVENIQGQQADGLRSQEAGQLVVPASSSQMNQAPFPNNNNNMFPQQMGQNGQANLNANNPNAQAQFLAQQHLQGGSNTPQDRMQFQAQQSQAQARAQAAQKAQMAMSGHGGQVRCLRSRCPLKPDHRLDLRTWASIRPALQDRLGCKVRPKFLPTSRPTSRNNSLACPPEQARAIIIQQRRAALNNMARANPGQQPQSQPGQAQSMMNNQMGNAMMRGAMNAPQDLTSGGIPPNQQITMQQRQQRQNEVYKLQLLRQQNNGVEMTPEQAKQMDRVSFPPSILNMNGTSMQVPNNVKSWGQLKQWANSNPQVASPNDLPRLMMLQKLHLGQLISASTNQVRDQNGQGPAATPFQSTQVPFTNAPGFPPGQQPTAINMAAMRPISAQDIQMARQKLGPQVSSWTDEQIQKFLYTNRQKQLQAAQNRAMQLEGNTQPGQLSQSAVQPPVPAAQAVPQIKQQHPQPPQSTPHAANVKTQTGATAKGAKGAPGKQPSKKRASTDDTTDARVTAEPQMSQPVAVPAPPGTAPQRPGLPFTQEQLAQMTPQQRAQVEAHIRRQQPQSRGQVLSRAAADEAWNRNLPPQVMEVYNDIAKNAPPAKPMPVSPEQKAAMTKQLREALDVLGRLDALVQWFAKMQGQEKNVKNLLAMRIQLMRQFKPSQDWVVNEHFTVTPDYLNGAILFMRKLFAVMISRMQQGQRPNAPQPPGSNTQAMQGNMPALNATNLQQLQAQEEALQRARRASSQSVANAPAAPFAAPSPRGVPQYAPGGLAPENLKLPPPKKRKQSHGVASSPVQATAAPGAAAKYNKAVADATSNAAAMAGAFKCRVVDCQHHYQGFPTQAALDKHIEESHQPEEEEMIEDYLKYYHESISMGLGLNPNDNGPAWISATLHQAKCRSFSRETKYRYPLIANNTPMARVTSQFGAKTVSPAASTQLLTPQLSSSKGTKPTGKDGKKDVLKMEESDTKDPWAECPTSLDTIHDTFSNLASKDLPHLGYDSLEDFDINEATPVDDDWAALASLTPPDEAEEAAFLEKFYEPWDDESIALAAARIRIPPEIQVKGKGPMGQLEVDWDAVARYEREGIPIRMT
ncbi:UAA transporter [Penicillium coprophilum]|uniref:UAA transporter n=1 Tax=Penicillium coprophilum TaxID=36646 RepID=UPI0023975FE7|nr:UAA transporter [Penicillium coprophilum]KAJ5163029.1 UAA transporter [Penicillium coprophilum]